MLCGEARAKAKARVRIARKARRAKARSVTLIRLEADVIYARAGRSQPDGWWRPATGASIFCSGDLRLGVIVQSNSAIASSLRNVSQDSLDGDCLRGRALITGIGLERDRLVVKLRICRRRRSRESGSTG